MKRFCINLPLLAIVAFVGHNACTNNPFGDEEIQRPDYKTIGGHLELNDNLTPDDIYVWLDGTSISTRTDRNGDFQLSLPPTSNNGSGTNGGAYSLYFYVGNYKISSARVLTRNNEFLFGQGDLDGGGRLFGAWQLTKLLHIRSQAFPSRVAADFAGPIDILMTLQATLDSVTVILPKVVGGLLGGIVLREKVTGQTYYNIPDIDADTRLIARVGGEPHSWRMVLNLFSGQFPPGRYEIIPYVLVEQDGVPPALLQSLGPNVEELSEDFLKLPFKREAGELIIGGSGAGD